MKNKQQHPKNKKPLLSVIVVSFNMEREIPRTLHSLSSKYQLDVSEEEYEVIVIDNGSTNPILKKKFQEFGSNFKYFLKPNPQPSPASAINYGVKLAKGKYVGILIDGARMLSPGVIKYALASFKIFKNPLIYTLGWHLGDDIQWRSITKGYNREIEDDLLKKINWPENGYRLFSISTFAGNSSKGWFVNVKESNCLFIKKEIFNRLNGYDEQFDKPGGGKCNHDFFKRACEIADSDLVVILGEGTFHQIHGGVATNNPDFRKNKVMNEYQDQYKIIRGKPFSTPIKNLQFIGHIPIECSESLAFSATVLEKKFRKKDNKLTGSPSGQKNEKRLEQENLGLEFKPGDRHYRAYVGPPQNYDLIAAMTFNLLTTIGLRQHHSLLDIGCGSLRIGRLFIPYLNVGKYTGIEPNEWLVKEGIRNEIGEAQVNIKKPNFYFDDKLYNLKKGIFFDFAFAQSIFSHCTSGLIERWLEELFLRLQSDGAFLATFIKDEKDFYNKAGINEKDIQGDGWIYPKIVSYKPETMTKLAKKTGFQFQILNWVHPRQTWALFAKPDFNTSWFKSKPLTWNTAMEHCPTMMKPNEKDKPT